MVTRTREARSHEDLSSRRDRSRYRARSCACPTSCSSSRGPGASVFV
jgi:hypothetical protein